MIPARPWALAAATAALVLAIGIGVGEWFGWPVLAAPLERWLSATLERRVAFAAPVDAPARAESLPPFQVRFLGGIRLRAPGLVIAAPAWSEAPHLLLARDVTLELRYADLWRARSGQPLRIHRLHAATLDGHLERLADGRASWQFGAAPAPGAPAEPMPTLGSLQVADGVLRYRDAPLALVLEARLSLVDAAASAASATPTAGDSAAGLLQVKANGSYRKLPLQLDLVSSGMLPWSADATLATAVPLRMNLTVGRTAFVFDGRATDAMHLGGLTGRFSLKGPSLAAVGDPIGVTLPTTGAFRAEGVVVKQGETYHVVLADATVGASHLNGAFVFEAGRGVPLLSGRLGGSRLLLADLGPAIGTAAVAAAAEPAPGPPGEQRADARSQRERVAAPRLAKPAGAASAPSKAIAKVLPDRPFDLAALRAMDANVAIDVAEVDLNTRLLEPLRPLRAQLQLTAGVLTLTGLDARSAQGRLQGDARLDGRGAVALWNTRLRWDGVRLERWIRQPRDDGAPPFVAGRLDGRASLKGQGISTADILASLSGDVRTVLRDGAVSHFAIEAAGLDLAESLGLVFQGDDALQVQCAVADLAVAGGVFSPRVVLDTADSTAWIDGTLSLATEAIDLRAVVIPKDFSPLTLRTPLRVGGSLAAPRVSVEAGPVGLKLGAAILLGLINPLAALLPLIDTGDSAEADRNALNCQSLMRRSQNKPQAASSPVRSPVRSPGR